MNNIVKAGIFAGLVYWTSAEGFWGDAQESEGLYRRIMFTISPVFEEVVDLRDVGVMEINFVTKIDCPSKLSSR